MGFGPGQSLREESATSTGRSSRARAFQVPPPQVGSPLQPASARFARKEPAYDRSCCRDEDYRIDDVHNGPGIMPTGSASPALFRGQTGSCFITPTATTSSPRPAPHPTFRIRPRPTRTLQTYRSTGTALSRCRTPASLPLCGPASEPVPDRLGPTIINRPATLFVLQLVVLHRYDVGQCIGGLCTERNRSWATWV